MISEFRKTNHLAIAGFLLPFLAAALASFYVLYGNGDYVSFRFKAVFFVLIPLILVTGFCFSIRSLALVGEKGDKDYAHSGLVLNIFFILFYLLSLVYALYHLTAS
jgi:hypothetical protein